MRWGVASFVVRALIRFCIYRGTVYRVKQKIEIRVQSPTSLTSRKNLLRHGCGSYRLPKVMIGAVSFLFYIEDLNRNEALS